MARLKAGSGITGSKVARGTSAGAAKNAQSLYGKNKAYSAGANNRMNAGGATGMAAHKAGLQSAGLS